MRPTPGCVYDSETTHVNYRSIWETHNGMAIPDGLLIRHLCHFRLCRNPDHLVLGTYRENARDNRYQDPVTRFTQPAVGVGRSKTTKVGRTFTDTAHKIMKRFRAALGPDPFSEYDLSDIIELTGIPEKIVIRLLVRYDIHPNDQGMYKTLDFVTDYIPHEWTEELTCDVT